MTEPDIGGTVLAVGSCGQEVAVGALPRPALPRGAARTLFDELHDLHHRAGWPSLRTMAKDVGCSHTTISSAFSGPAVPRWGLLELIVECLGGDTEAFHRMWLTATTGAAPAEPVETHRVPRQLPADVPAFTGRAGQIADLDGLLGTAGASSGAVVVAAVCGTPGVGKTALAVHWAHRVADRFPDGQLYVNLRGYDPERPMPAAEALELLLRSLCVGGADLPQDTGERAGRLRTLLTGRRILLLLDNAHSVDQIRDLLPGTATCLVLVTSRDSMPALVARHGAVRINLDLLPATDAVALLRTLIGPRVDAEPDAARALVERCARLPLALRITAELAVTRPMACLAALVGELADEPPLDLLAAGDDEYTAVRAVFSWSCEHLPETALSAFGLLGLHPGQEIDAAAAAALFGTSVAHARRTLSALARAHLVDERAGGRFGMHDLLRAYAAEQAADRLDREAALTRLYDHYLDRAGADASEVARAWLVAERATLLAVAASSPRHAIGLSARLAYPLDTWGQYQTGLALHGIALRAAMAAGDRAAEADALNWLGVAHRRIGSYREAADHHERALVIHRSTGDLAGQGAALHGIGTVAWRAGRYSESRDHLTEALALYRELGDEAGQGRVLYALGTVYRQLGHYRQALDHQTQALAAEQRLGDAIGESRVHNNIGTTLERLGRDDEAETHFNRALEISTEHGNRLGASVALTNLAHLDTKRYRLAEALDRHRQALRLYREVGYRVGIAEALAGVGEAHRRMGRVGEALASLREAVALSREIGDAGMETSALIALGDVLRAANTPGEARTAYSDALALAERAGDRYEQARALTGHGHVSASAEQARQYWAKALAIFDELDVPDGDDLRPRLGASDSSPPPQST